MANKRVPVSIDEYVAGFTQDTQRALIELLNLVRASLPNATETIAYGMPTFDLGEKHVLHFAGFAEHVALYPVPDWFEAFGEEATPYRSGQGTLKFPLGKPLPADLIRRIVEFSAAHSGGGSDKPQMGSSPGI